MPVRPDAPLRKVTLNLYEADCQALEKAYGHGWTTEVRNHIHNQVMFYARYEDNIKATRRRTLGDLADD